MNRYVLISSICFFYALPRLELSQLAQPQRTDRLAEWTCLLNVVLFQRLRRAVYGVLLHILGHVGILDDRFPFRHVDDRCADSSPTTPTKSLSRSPLSLPSRRAGIQTSSRRPCRPFPVLSFPLTSLACTYLHTYLRAAHKASKSASTTSDRNAHSKTGSERIMVQ